MWTPKEIEAKYQEFCNTPSDINQHLPKLREYYDQCESITEFGVRTCCSLLAALASSAKKVIAYDILDVWVPKVEKLTFICADDLKVEIEETDFLFIDTMHSYKQLKAELTLHAAKVNKWIGMHDTTIYKLHSEDGSAPGLMQAIMEFLAECPEWELTYMSVENNGLTVLSRRI